MVYWFKQLDRVLRGEAIRFSTLRSGEIEQPISGLVIIGMLLGAIYGACMGSYAFFQNASQPLSQIIAATFKVPLLFFLTLCITLPSLYVFSALVGSRLSLRSVFRLLIIALTVTIAVLASLGPIVAFFSASTQNYHFIKLLNVLVFSVAGLLGMRIMLVALNRLNIVINQKEVQQATSPTPPPTLEEHLTMPQPPPVPTVTPLPKPLSLASQTGGEKVGGDVRLLFRLWVCVFGIVGAQMGWVLRPFLGAPNVPFTWFRPSHSNFFEAFFNALGNLFKG